VLEKAPVLTLLLVYFFRTTPIFRLFWKSTQFSIEGKVMMYTIVLELTLKQVFDLSTVCQNNFKLQNQSYSRELTLKMKIVFWKNDLENKNMIVVFWNPMQPWALFIFYMEIDLLVFCSVRLDWVPPPSLAEQIKYWQKWGIHLVQVTACCFL
jgi:hypothetical protein